MAKAKTAKRGVKPPTPIRPSPGKPPAGIRPGPGGPQVIDSAVFMTALGEKEMELFIAKRTIRELQQALIIAKQRITELEPPEKGEDTEAPPDEA